MLQKTKNPIHNVWGLNYLMIRKRVLPVLSFQKRLLTTCEHAKDEGLILFYPFKIRLLTTILVTLLVSISLFYPFKWRLLTTTGKSWTVFLPVLPFQKKAINNLFRAKPYNKGIYNRKVNEFFHNFMVSLLPNTLLFMFHSHYFIKYSKN